MSTRSFIGIRNEDFTITGVYSHWDGYPEWVGSKLLNNYRNETTIRELISHGDISGLGGRIAPDEGEEHTFDHPADDVTVFYHRDRNEEWETVKPKTYNDFLEIVRNSWYDYIYIWEPEKGGKWYVGDVQYITHFDMFRWDDVNKSDKDPVIKTVTEYVPLTREICESNRMPSNTLDRALEIAESYCRANPHSIKPGEKKVGMMRVFLDALENANIKEGE